MKRFLNIALAVMLCVLCAFSLTACNNDDESTSKKGLLIKKMNGIYTIYDYVDDNTLVNGELDIGAILSEKGYDNVTIKRGTFDDVTNIKTLKVSDRVTKIEEGAFRNMKGLENLEIPFVGKTAKADAYENQTGGAVDKAVNRERTFAHFFGTEVYDGATAMTDIDGQTVYLPTTLKTVTINVTEKVFYEVNDVDVKGKFYAIPYKAFMGATNLTNINLITTNVVNDELGLQEIGEEAFSGCAMLKEIVIPATVSTIYKNAFENCTNLTKVIVEGSNVKLKENVFKGCVKMNKFNSDADLTANLISFASIGKGALDFGRESVKYTVLNGSSFDLTNIFGQTLTK